MARQRVIVAIGEALVCEYPDRVDAGGLAVRCAQQAAKLGHVGVAISRLGQDATADEFFRLVKGLGISTEHLQSDPDLPTGRLRERRIGTRIDRQLQPRAAFDNLQWDFDLVDVAQQADAVIFGELARRQAQSRSIIKRFLAECHNALRVLDLTNRDEGPIDRVEAESGLELAEGVLVDEAALRAVVPGWGGEGEKQVRRSTLGLIQRHGLDVLIWVSRQGDRELMEVHSVDEVTVAPGKYPSCGHEGAVIGLVLGVLAGHPYAKCLEQAVQAGSTASGGPCGDGPGKATGG